MFWNKKIKELEIKFKIKHDLLENKVCLLENRIERLESKLKQYDEMFGVEIVAINFPYVTHPFYYKIGINQRLGIAFSDGFFVNCLVPTKIVELIQAIGLEYKVTPESKSYVKAKK